MNRVVLRSAFFVLPLVAAAWAGCGSSPEPALATAADGGRSAPEASVSEAAPPIDANVDAPPVPKRDCSTDAQADGLMQHLECTGLYADFATRTLATAARAYTPGVTFWSDGAEKARFLYLPPGTTIDITSFDDWKFPVGTTAWKEFKLGGKRIETRMFIKTAANDWRHTTYRWNDAETDAVRMDSGEKIASASGGAPYEIPSKSQCDQCHSGRPDQLLGVEAVGLGIATAKGITLATLAAEGRFNTSPPATTITIPDGYNGTAAPALGWLHANCSPCHASNGLSGTTLYWRLRPTQLIPDGGTPAVEDLDPWTSAVNVDSTRWDVDAGAGVVYKRIAAGSPSASLAWILTGRRAPIGSDPNTAIQMPPLVSRTVDTQGHALLEAWIAQIP